MRVSIGDIRLFFEVEGPEYVPDGPTMRRKPTLLLLHGGPGWDHSAFMPAFSQLTDIVQVVYYDHRGQGRSDRSDPEHWNLAQWGDDVVALCEALGIEKPYVLGSSFGGTVAMSYATRHPDHPGKLILTNTTGHRRQDLILDTFERIGGPEIREIARGYVETPGPETMALYLERCLPLYGKRPMTAEAQARVIENREVAYHYAHHERTLPDGTVEKGEAKRFNFLPELARVRCPTLVMAGSEDPITPVECGEAIAAALPAHLSRFHRFEGAGHTLFWEEPEAFFTVLRRFLLEDIGS